ncbi:MAG: YIP1 family protein [Verrucomicrobiota bacterium]|nr:YIP1 family protein [Verrucomicrobiota bacterium]
MANIHINRGGATLGPFSEEEVREGLRTGRFAESDLGWQEGMAEWQTLSRFPQFTGVTPNAGALPPAAAAEIARTGLPWDNRAATSVLTAFIATLKAVLTTPDQAFRMMRRDGGLWNPMLFAVSGGTLGFVVSIVLQLGLQSLGVGLGGDPEALKALGVTGAVFVALLIFSPVFVAIGLFVSSAIVHVCLMLVGGAKQPFETTFRVMAYTQGSMGILQMIPFCGGIIAAIWGLICQCIGLARAHEIETGRAALAIFLPLILCCGAAIAIAIFAGGFAAFQHGLHQ